MSKQYRDEIAMVCHDMMKDAHSVGGASDSELEKFESDCFVQETKPEFKTEKTLELAQATA